MKPFVHRILKGVCVGLFFFTQDAFSQESPLDPYAITDVSVDVQGAGDARLKAVEEAQKIALGRLLDTGILPDGAARSLRTLKTGDIDKLVKDIEITQEKISSARYMATFTVTFKEEAIQALGASQDEENVDTRPLPQEKDLPDSSSAPLSPAHAPEGRSAVVVPVFLAKGRLLLWEEDNPWFHALMEDIKLSPALILPTGDLSDMDALDLAAARKPSAHNLTPLRAHYDAPTAVVATFEEDVSGATLLTLSLFDEQGLVAQDTKPLPQEDLNAQLKASIPLLTAFVQHPPKLEEKQTSVVEDASIFQSNNELIVNVSFAGLDAWMTYKKRLETFPGVGQVSLVSLTKTDAKVRVEARANKNTLARSLTNAGFVVEKETTNSSAPSSLTPDILHELPQSY